MSARDAESGSSTYKGGSGRAGGIGNGGIGGGMGGGGNYGGGWGGGAGFNGGYGNRTGLTTGANWFGNTAFGRPGMNAMNPGAWGIQNLPQVSQMPMNRPAVPGMPTPVPASIPGVNPVPQYPYNPPPDFYRPPTIPAGMPPNFYSWQPPYNPNYGPQRPTGPDPLGNDLSRLVHAGAPPLNIPGVGGGYGVPGYNGNNALGHGIKSPGGGGW